MMDCTSIDVPAVVRGDEGVAGRWLAASEETYFARLQRPACRVNEALVDFAARWTCERRFLPQMDDATRERKWAGWRDAVARTLSVELHKD